MSNTNEKIDLVEILKSESSDNKLSCAKTFEIINKYSIFPDIAGFSMNHHKIKISLCQLGLFGFPEGKSIPDCEDISETLEDKIFSLIQNDKLPCAAAWNIASEMKFKKIDIASACEKLGIKISKCQLGAF